MNIEGRFQQIGMHDIDSFRSLETYKVHELRRFFAKEKATLNTLRVI